MKKTVVAVLCFCLATVTAQAAPTVLFDQGHGQRFVVEREGDLDLSGLAGIMRQKGFVVKTGTGKLTPESLAGVEALVVSGPFSSYTAGEAQAVKSFLERGGKMAVMLHIGAPAGPLLQPLGVDFSNGVIHETTNIIDGKDLNFTVANLDSHPVFKGITSFNIYGGWAVVGFMANTQTGARTSAKAWIDLNGDGKHSAGDAVDSFGVIVAGTQGSGSFLVFADDAIFQNRFLQGNNKVLAENLAGWLKPAE